MANIYGSNIFEQLMTKQGVQGLAKGLGQDYGGNNELGNTFRRGGFGLTPDFLNRISFLNEIGPQRIEAIRGLMSRFSPGNMEVVSEENRARYQRQGEEDARMAMARLAGMGASQAAQQGAALAARNKATDAFNQYQNQLNSAEGQTNILGALLNATGQAENLNLQNLMPLFQAIETRNSANTADKARGGLGGILGSLAGSALGGINWGSVFKPPAPAKGAAR